MLLRHVSLSVVERHKEQELYGVILMLLQGIMAAAALISLLHQIMLQTLAFIVLIIYSANAIL